MKRITGTNYPTGDFLIRIKNAAMSGNKEVLAAKNSKVLALAACLKKMGFLSESEVDGNMIKVSLSFKNKKPILMDLRLVSTPGLRIYMNVSELEDKKGPSTYVVSTPKGIVSSREAIKQKVGGEVIAEVW